MVGGRSGTESSEVGPCIASTTAASAAAQVIVVMIISISETAQEISRNVHPLVMANAFNFHRGHLRNHPANSRIQRLRSNEAWRLHIFMMMMMIERWVQPGGAGVWWCLQISQERELLHLLMMHMLLESPLLGECGR